MSAERRQFSRVNLATKRSASVDINGADFIDILRVVDISEGGVGIRVPHGFAGCNLEQAVTFVLTLPDGTRKANTYLKGLGKIKHISGDQFGIAFHPLSERTQTQLRGYIASLKKEESFFSWLKYKFSSAA